MPSRKRAASSQLTREQYEAGEDTTVVEQKSGKAAPEVIAARKKFRAKRIGKPAAKPAAAAAAPKSFPTFSFGGSAAVETPAAVAPAAPAAEEPVNAFAALIPKGSWSCSSCMLMNDAKLDKCAACELAKGGADPAAAAEPEPVNAFAALIPKGSWSCSSCMLMNDAKLDKCAACELSKDGVAAETDGLAILKSDKDAPTFTFGAGPGATLTTDATTDTTTTTTPAFNFGAGDTPTFTFGGVTTAATPDKTAAPSTVPATGFTFGEGNTNISFGNVATDNVSTGFNAGSFKFEATTSLESQNTTVDPSAAVFKEEDSKDTGMETDQKHFEIRGKAYEFVTDAETKKSKYSERGVGNAFVSTVEVKEKLHGRIVMHTDKTKRLVLNVPIFPGMTKEVFNNTYVKFLTYDADKTAHVYLIRVKTAEDAKALLAGIDKAVNKMETFNKKK